MNDKEMLYEKYGKDIMLGIDAPAEPEGASDEEIEAIAKEFIEKHKAHPIMITTRATSQKMVEALYRQSRYAFGG